MGDRTKLLTGVDQTVCCQPLNSSVRHSTAWEPGNDFTATSYSASEGLSERCG